MFFRASIRVKYRAVGSTSHLLLTPLFRRLVLFWVVLMMGEATAFGRRVGAVDWPCYEIFGTDLSSHARIIPIEHITRDPAALVGMVEASLRALGPTTKLVLETSPLVNNNIDFSVTRPVNGLRPDLRSELNRGLSSAYSEPEVLDFKALLDFAPLEAIYILASNACWNVLLLRSEVRVEPLLEASAVSEGRKIEHLEIGADVLSVIYQTSSSDLVASTVAYLNRCERITAAGHSLLTRLMGGKNSYSAVADYRRSLRALDLRIATSSAAKARDARLLDRIRRLVEDNDPAVIVIGAEHLPKWLFFPNIPGSERVRQCQ